MKGKAKDLKTTTIGKNQGKTITRENRAKRIITPLWGTTKWGKKEVNGDLYLEYIHYSLL